VPIATKRKSSKKATVNNPFDIVDLVARSSNVKEADDIISAFYPTSNVKQKFNFLRRNFKFNIVSGSAGTKELSQYYGLVIKSILSKVRDFGVDSVKK